MTQVGHLRQIWLLGAGPLIPYLERHTQNSSGFPKIEDSRVPYFEYPTWDRKATPVESLHQIRLPWVRLSLVNSLLGTPYSE